jgi:hypothetical protein
MPAGRIVTFKVATLRQAEALPGWRSGPSELTILDGEVNDPTVHWVEGRVHL